VTFSAGYYSDLALPAAVLGLLILLLGSMAGLRGLKTLKKIAKPTIQFEH